jgi:DNA-binding phage protein
MRTFYKTQQSIDILKGVFFGVSSFPFVFKVFFKKRIAQAKGGMATVAERSNLKRENLYRTLSKGGNPELRTFYNILHGMGLKLAIVPETA